MLTATNATIAGTILANDGELGSLEINGVLTIDSGGSIVAGGVTLDSVGLQLTSGSSSENRIRWTGGGFIQQNTGNVLHLESSGAVTLNTNSYSVGLINGNAAFEPVSGSPTLGSNSSPWSNLYLSSFGSVAAVLNDFESRISALENP